VRTGKYTDAALRAAGGEPDHLIDSVADLPALLRIAAGGPARWERGRGR